MQRHVSLLDFDAAAAARHWSEHAVVLRVVESIRKLDYDSTLPRAPHWQLATNKVRRCSLIIVIRDICNRESAALQQPRNSPRGCTINPQRAHGGGVAGLGVFGGLAGVGGGVFGSTRAKIASCFKLARFGQSHDMWLGNSQRNTNAPHLFGHGAGRFPSA